MNKQLIVGLLIVSMAIPTLSQSNTLTAWLYRKLSRFTTSQTSRCEQWSRQYNVKDFGEPYKNCIASYIHYLSLSDPSEKTFTQQRKTITRHFPQAPWQFLLAITKIYENAYDAAYKSHVAVLQKQAWNETLDLYYSNVYNMLKVDNKVINYGTLQGQVLPAPRQIVQFT